MKKRLLCLSFFISLSTLVSCASQPRMSPNSNLISESDYYERIEKATRKQEHYDGLMNLLTYSATMLSNDVAQAQIDHQARLYQYDEAAYQNEKSKSLTDRAKQTDFFLSFFVPEKRYDDLAKKSTKWKIFLDVAGKRYEAKVSKMKNQLAELTQYYPNHTRWSTAYKLTFPISTSITEAGSPKLTITGPLTSSSVQF
jgi:hypothetical protein